MLWASFRNLSRNDRTNLGRTAGQAHIMSTKYSNIWKLTWHQQIVDREVTRWMWAYYSTRATSEQGRYILLYSASYHRIYRLSSIEIWSLLNPRDSSMPPEVHWNHPSSCQSCLLRRIIHNYWMRLTVIMPLTEGGNTANRGLDYSPLINKPKTCLFP